MSADSTSPTVLDLQVLGHYQRIAAALLFVQAVGVGAWASVAGPFSTEGAGLLATICATTVAVALCLREAGLEAMRARRDAGPALRLQQRLWAVIALVSWPASLLIWVVYLFPTLVLPRWVIVP